MNILLRVYISLLLTLVLHLQGIVFFLNIFIVFVPFLQFFILRRPSRGHAPLWIRVGGSLLGPLMPSSTSSVASASKRLKISFVTDDDVRQSRARSASVASAATGRDFEIVQPDAMFRFKTKRPMNGGTNVDIETELEHVDAGHLQGPQPGTVEAAEVSSSSAQCSMPADEPSLQIPASVISWHMPWYEPVWQLNKPLIFRSQYFHWQIREIHCELWTLLQWQLTVAVACAAVVHSQLLTLFGLLDSNQLLP